MTHTELEIILRARDEASVKMKALGDALDGVAGHATTTGKAAEGMGSNVAGAAARGAAAGVIFMGLAETMGRGLKTAFESCLDEANKLDAGLIGLSSVAKAFGHDSDQAKAAATSLAADGLMSVGEAASGLKNLLAAGFGLDQSIELMHRFKDSAAFGRQGSLDFGQAVVSATEGIKNGNSILVDNAGVTKNLSVILTEAGLSASDLGKASSDTNVRMALFNGILKETTPQLGDAGRYLDTTAGKQAQFNAQITIAQQQIGKQLQPALAGLLSALTPVVGVVANNAEVFVRLSAAAAAVVAPLLAVKAASALGVTSLAGLTTGLGGALNAAIAMPPALVKTTTALKETTVATGLLAANGQPAMRTVATEVTVAGNAAAVTAAKFRLMQQALLAAMLVPAAWEVGRAIGKVVSDLDEYSRQTDTAGQKTAGFFAKWLGVHAVVGGIQGITESAATAWDGTASLSTQIGIMRDASERAGRVVTSYAEAVRILGADLNPAESALKRFNAELAKAIKDREIKVPTMKDAEALQAQFDAIAAAAETSRKRIDGWRGEISRLSAIGGLPALRRELDLGVLSTKELALQFGVSEDAIKYYEKGLKSSADAAKAHAKAQKDAAEESVRSTAINTKAINEWLDNLAEHAANVRAESRRTQEAITATLRASIDQSQSALLANVKTQVEAEQGASRIRRQLVLSDRDFQISVINEEIDAKIAALDRGSLRYGEAVAALNELRAAQIAQATATKGFLREVTEAAKGTVSQLQTALSGTFAQMMLGAKGFKEGFVDIWSSLKASLTRLFAEIADSFVSGLLKRMLASMAGQQGAFAGGFAGLFSGLGGGVAGSGGSMIGPEIGAGWGTGSMLTPGGGGTNWGAMAGGGLMAAGGLFSLLKAQGLGANLMSGATAGAGIGTTIAPGIGTAIGAGAGALVGLVKNLFGGNSAGRQADADATGQIQALQQQLLATYGSLDKIRALGQQVGVDLAGAWGDKSRAGLVNFTGLVEQFTTKLQEQNAKLQEQQRIQGEISTLEQQIGAIKAGQVPTWQEMNGLIQQYGIDLGGLGNAVQQLAITDEATRYIDVIERLKAGGADLGGVLVGMGDEIGKLVQKSIDFGVAIPENMRPWIEQLAKSGDLVDANGKKITDISQIKWGDPIETEADKSNKTLNALNQTLMSLRDMLAQQLPAAAATSAAGVKRAFEGLDIRISPEIDMDGLDGLGLVGVGGGGVKLEMPGYATGSLITKPHAAVVGEGGEPELIGPVSFMSAALTGALARVGLPSGDSATLAEMGRLRSDISGLRRDLTRQSRLLPLQLRDAVLLARG